MKKLALILALVLVFAMSCVFAAPALEVSGEANSEAVSGEVISGEADTVTSTDSGEAEAEITPESGNVIDEDEPLTDISYDEEDVTETDSDKGAVVGAIIAIAIVIIVVAIAAILKKD